MVACSSVQARRNAQAEVVATRRRRRRAAARERGARAAKKTKRARSVSACAHDLIAQERREK
jgi:hypothetical protein